jgi:hypothetical protein
MALSCKLWKKRMESALLENGSDRSNATEEAPRTGPNGPKSIFRTIPDQTICSASDSRVVWAAWCTSASPRRPADPLCPTPTSSARRRCSRICSGPCWRAFATSKPGVLANTGSGSRTSCLRWIQRPSRCASRCFLGPRSAAPRAASKLGARDPYPQFFPPVMG